MKDITKFLIPTAFVLLAAFSFYGKKWTEGILYLMVGIEYTLIYMIRSKIVRNTKLWNGVSWALVILCIFLFLLVLLQDANKEILILQPII